MRRMKLLVLLLWVAVPALADQASNRGLDLICGMGHHLPMPAPVEEIGVVDPGICDYAVSGDGTSVHLLPRTPGSTRIVARTITGQELELHVRVLPNLASLADQLRSRLASVEGLVLEVREHHVLLGGELLTLKDERLVREAAEEHPRILVETHLHPEALAAVAAALRDALARPSLQVTVLGGERLLLQGEVESTQAAERARNLAHYFAGPRLLDGLTVREDLRPPRTGATQAFQVTVAVVSSSFARRLGLSWPESLQPALQLELQSPDGRSWDQAWTGTLAGFLPRLEAAESLGEVRRLAQGWLIARDGERSTALLGGGRIPIRMRSSSDEDTIQYERFGYEISLEPRLLDSGCMDLRCELGLCFPGEAGEGGYPVLYEDRIRLGGVTLQPGESLVVGGHSDRIQHLNGAGLPGSTRRRWLRRWLGRRERTRQDRSLLWSISPFSEPLDDPSSLFAPPPQDRP